MSDRPDTAPPIPQLPFDKGPSLPPVSPEKFIPTWVRTREGWTLSVWATEPVDGLAVQVAPWRAEPKSRLEWHLAILHVASGFVAVSKRKLALARELGGEEHIPLAIEIYRFEQAQATERDNVAACARFDLDEPYDAGWRWREFT